MSFKPMLADAPDESRHPLRFPFLASPKLDGVRCIITPQGARTRALKPIPNKWLAAQLSRPEFVGLDGELICGSPTAPDAMQRTTSGVMRHEGKPDCVFYVFDHIQDWEAPESTGFSVRTFDAEGAAQYADSPLVQYVQHVKVRNAAELKAISQEHLAAGYEGTMLRAINGPYKFGRATAKEQTLLKIKHRQDDEGEVLDAYERQHNENEQTRDERGFAKRSSAAAGKVGADTLGGFVVRLGAAWKAPSVKVATGWTDEQRAELWAQWCADPASLRGRLLKYKYQLEGAKDAPRLPIAIGWRDKRDT